MATHAERERAWAIHQAEGGHADSDVCYGPTIFDLDRAKAELAAEVLVERKAVARVKKVAPE